MGNNRRILAKRFKSRVKLSRSPFKPGFWSLDPTDRGVMGPHCILHGLVWPEFVVLFMSSLEQEMFIRSLTDSADFIFYV